MTHRPVTGSFRNSGNLR